MQKFCIRNRGTLLFHHHVKIIDKKWKFPFLVRFCLNSCFPPLSSPNPSSFAEKNLFTTFFFLYMIPIFGRGPRNDMAMELKN